jgi:hypothetical protein
MEFAHTGRLDLQPRTLTGLVSFPSLSPDPPLARRDLCGGLLPVLRPAGRRVAVLPYVPQGGAMADITILPYKSAFRPFPSSVGQIHWVIDTGD